MPRGKKDGELDDEAYIADKEHRQLYKHFALVAAAEALEQAGWQPSSEQQQCRTGLYARPIDVLNKDCRRSISAILTWVPENVKISARPLNSIGN